VTGDHHIGGAEPHICKLGVTQHPLALYGDCGDGQTDERIPGDLLALGRPVECGARIRKRAGRRHGLRTSHQFVEHIDDFSSGDARRWTFQKIDERMFDHALRLLAIALAAMCKVQLAPLIHQSLKAQRRFGPFAVLLSLEPQPLHPWIDPLGYLPHAGLIEAAHRERGRASCCRMSRAIQWQGLCPIAKWPSSFCVWEPASRFRR